MKPVAPPRHEAAPWICVRYNYLFSPCFRHGIYFPFNEANRTADTRTAIHYYPTDLINLVRKMPEIGFRYCAIVRISPRRAARRVVKHFSTGSILRTVTVLP